MNLSSSDWDCYRTAMEWVVWQQKSNLNYLAAMDVFKRFVVLDHMYKNKTMHPCQWKSFKCTNAVKCFNLSMVTSSPWGFLKLCYLGTRPLDRITLLVFTSAINLIHDSSIVAWQLKTFFKSCRFVNLCKIERETAILKRDKSLRNRRRVSFNEIAEPS